MRKRSKCFLHLILFLNFISCGTSFQVGCNARDGNYYRHGETTVTREGNNRLYKCMCLNGQRNCSVTKEDGHVLIANVNQINKITLAAGKGFEDKYIQNLPGIAVSVGVDIESDLIFWTDVSYEHRGIYRARYSDGSRITKILSFEIYEPNGIAVDWFSKNIYWTDAQLGAIFVAKNDGRLSTRLISGLPEPRSITILPWEPLLFWSDQKVGTIERARMDGSERRIIITGLVWPNELVVDRLSRRIYWIDAYQKRIESCNWNGGDYSRIFDYSYTGYNLPGFGLALFQDHLYFGLWNTTGRHSSLFSITKIGQHFAPVVKSLGPKPMGITIINRNMQTEGQNDNVNGCWSPGSGICSHLCLPTSLSTYRCACPSNTGLVLSRDGRNCVVPERFLLYTSLTEGTVMMVSIEDGADRIPTLFAQGSRPSAVAFDPVDRVVYWSDIAVNAIFRKRLGDINATKFIQDGIGVVDGICVDYVNRHLYFTNMGWYSSNSPYHQIEMVDLRDAGNRKILTSSMLEKPRDILIDQEFGQFLYVSDWGKNPKVVRLDLDGQSPFVLPVDVENPNGIALKDHNLYIVDSHVKSAIVRENGTTIFSRPPSLISYDLRFSNSSSQSMINIEVPFGLAGGRDKLYMTDWGLKGIYTVDVNERAVEEFIVGIKKPTGITEASLRYRRYQNVCYQNSRQCSDICVSIGTVDYQCMCPDRAGTALSYFNCVLPDTFLLIADQSQIVMKSFDPQDDQRYAVVRTFDLLSNIVALTYDPEADFIYWADIGRQQIARKNFRDRNTQFEVLYTDIGRVEGMALDPVHRLLYWTDAEKGTIELMSLTRRVHTVVRNQLSHPRAIALNLEAGLMYWTEEGDLPMVLSATMTGQDIRPLITSDLKWPNALYYDQESDLLWIADGGTLEIMSLTTGENPTILDHRDQNGTAGHIYGLWRDPTSESVSMIYSDWKNRAIVKGSHILMKDLIRPSQIYVQNSYRGPVVYDHCQSACSHICVPTRESFACMCPEDLTLSNDFYTCITAEQLFLMTSTTESTVITTTTTLPATTTSAPWALLITDASPKEFQETSAVVVSTEEQMITSTSSLISTTMERTSIDTTTALQTTTVATLPTTTTVPGDPYFADCDEINTYQISLPDNDSVAVVSAALLNLRAFDGTNSSIPVTILDELKGENVESIKLPPENFTIRFQAHDGYGRLISCDVRVVVTDNTSPKALFCPTDIQAETYSEKGEAFVEWNPPKFVDNSGILPQITQTFDPGTFEEGLFNITYKATDSSKNVAYCRFLLVVLQKESKCNIPPAPSNSELMCQNNQGTQQCRISCNEHYQISLADPHIKCEDNIKDEASAWVPFLSSGICAKPLASNVEQEVYLQYNCPCQPEFTYYERARGMLFQTIKDYTGCRRLQHRYGYCNDRKKGTLQLECIRYELLNVTLTVDLDNLRGIGNTDEARRIVKRGVNRVVDGALDGSIVAPSGSKSLNYTVNKNTLRISNATVKCGVGFKATEKGCVQCPKGTSLENNQCKFCPKNTYQDEAGREYCTKCPERKGTKTIGATDQIYCVQVKVESSTPVELIIASIAGIVLLLVAIALLIIFIRRRKINNKIKEEQMRKRKQLEERRRRRRTRSTESKKSKRSEISRHGRRKSLSSKSNNNLSAIENGNCNDLNKNNGSTKNETINSKSSKQKSGSDNPGDPIISDHSNPTSKVQSNPAPKNDPKTTEEKGRESPEGENSVTALEEETKRKVPTAPTAPLKSALKKPKNPSPPESYLEDDISTIISTSTIASAQLRKANIRPRSSSLDKNPNTSSFERGRPSGKSMTIKKQIGSNGRNRSDPVMPGQPSRLRRSMSFDRRDEPRRSYSQANLHAIRAAQMQPMIRSGVSQQPPGMRIPLTAPRANFTLGPPPVNPPPIYGSFSPHRLPPPPRMAMFGPRGAPRHRMMQPGASGTLPRMRGGFGGFWNDGYDPNQAWEQMQLGNRPEVALGNNMMTFPRAPMPPRFLVPGTNPNLRLYPRIQHPNSYYS